MKIIISGASGFVGAALVEHLEKRNHDIIKLVRRPQIHGSTERRWDPTTTDLDPQVVSGADFVINLNGRSISQGRWSRTVKEELRSSRLDATRTIVQAITRAESPPPLLINASATGYYGDRENEELTEDSAPGAGFLADLSRDWEATAVGGGTRGGPDGAPPAVIDGGDYSKAMRAVSTQAASSTTA